MADVTTDNILDPKDLTAGTPAADDVIIYRDISETAPTDALKKCTPSQVAQSIIDDTTASTTSVYSSSKLNTDFAKKSDLTPTTTQITFVSGTTSEPTANTYTVVGKICIVTLSTFTDTNSSNHVIVANLPKCKTRSTTKYGNAILYIETNSTDLRLLNSESVPLWCNLTYPITD